MRRLLSIVLVLGLVLSFSLVTAVPALAFTEVWVDDDFDSSTPGWSVTHFNSIQDGIDYISVIVGDPEGGIVNVAAGTYFVTEDIELKNGVDVLGAGAGVTTIDSDGISGSVVSANGIDSSTTIDGFTVTNGSAGSGGGMYINTSSLTVTNCIFTGNTASLMGGGMYILDSSSPTVANCIFEDNEVTGYNGGGICCWGTGSSTIINNTIVNNTADDYGGGIYIGPTSSAIITNNIIVGNTATLGGGGIHCATGTLSIDYNDVWGNSPNEYYGCTEGPGHISADPEFVDEGAGDYHLDSSVPSPCIDAGDSGAALAAGLTTDYDGEPRIYPAGGTVDMGADEYYVLPPPPPPSRGTVGGEVYPIDKAAILLPWLGLGAFLILAAGGLILIRRRSR